MIYSVIFGTTSIYGYDGDVVLIDPKVVQEINTAGSFEFTMPATHPFYDLPEILTPEVEVYEGDEMIFFGRPTEISVDIDLQKRVYCEGGLAYFNDSIQRPKEFKSIDIRDFFTYLIEEHNNYVPENRRFQVGNITVANKTVYRILNYETTLKCLTSMCTDAEGGYLLVRKENGTRYIDWYSDAPFVGDQPIRFGLNIVDMSQSINSDFVTSVIPIGAENLTIVGVNGGRDYLDSDYISDYGRITAVANFEDCTDADELMLLGAYYLAEQQYGKVTIEVNATELHYINDEYVPFRIGQKVQVYSKPHGIDAVFPVTKMELDLSSSVKEITVGTLERKELTEIVKEDSGKTATTIYWDQTPTEGSNRAVTSAGVYSALGPLRFTVNENGTVSVREVSSDT